MEREKWSIGVLECWKRQPQQPTTPTLQLPEPLYRLFDQQFACRVHDLEAARCI